MVWHACFFVLSRFDPEMIIAMAKNNLTAAFGQKRTVVVASGKAIQRLFTANKVSRARVALAVQSICCCLKLFWFMRWNSDTLY